MFANLVQELELEFGPDSLIVAPAWYEYGNALLSAEEENPANDVLGDVKKFAKESAQEGLGSDPFEDDEDVEDDEHETIDNQAVDREDDEVGVAEVQEKCKMEPNSAEEGAEQAQETEKDLDGDIQLAWECLEVSLITLIGFQCNQKNASVLINPLPLPNPHSSSTISGLTAIV